MRRWVVPGKGGKISFIVSCRSDFGKKMAASSLRGREKGKEGAQARHGRNRERQLHPKKKKRAQPFVMSKKRERSIS